MQYVEHDLGHQSAGAIVEVTLRGTEANVQLVDTTNRTAYKQGRQFRYYGGHYKRSPVRITVPHAGHWYVMVDLGGYGGRVSSSARVFAT
jgi:hypothetical protein